MLITTSAINSKAEQGKEKFIEESEKQYQERLKKAAEKICLTEQERPLILISGPSGSGKTTTAIKLYQTIRSMGHKVCYISMDRYFKNFSEEEKILKQQNKIDLESPERVDSEHLNRDLDILLNGGKIELPAYDFSTNTRRPSGKTIDRQGGFVILEGIHALNPDILGDTDSSSTRIYVSVRSRLIDSNGDKLHPCKIRLMRRMMRDKLYRGRQIEETVRLFPSVQRGENRYILPYKYRSDEDIDTFIPYEACVYRDVLFSELKGIADKYADIRDIVQGLDEILPISPKLVPGDALLREFIGDSSLKY